MSLPASIRLAGAGLTDSCARARPPQKELFIELASDVEVSTRTTHDPSSSLTPTPRISSSTSSRMLSRACLFKLQDPQLIPDSSDRVLDNLQRTQQALFRKTVDHLCRTISAAARPPTSSTSTLGAKLKRGDGHTDLYAWREVFTLWIEAEIFESGAERTRGERSVQEAERRLKAFAGEVTRRGLGDRRTFKVRIRFPVSLSCVRELMTDRRLSSPENPARRSTLSSSSTSRSSTSRSFRRPTSSRHARS